MSAVTQPYPSKEYHDKEDKRFILSGPRYYAFSAANEFIELMALAVPDETGRGMREPTDQEFAEALVQLHNRCVENINMGQSVPRYRAVLTETRQRMKGVLAPDEVLRQLPVLLGLD